MDFVLNGFGRVGRALFRIAFYDGRNMCTHINEPNASIDDIIYFLKYDSLYASFKADVDKVNENSLFVEGLGRKWLVMVTHYSDPNFLTENESVIVDASGEAKHIDTYKLDKKILIFTSSSSSISKEVILGFNDKDIDQISPGDIISGSICDSVAIVPILGLLMQKHNVSKVLITTMHPALSYQKVIDNYTSKGINRSLGRQYIDSMIPKRTSLETVLKRHFGSERILIRCMSFRIPTESVCSADLSLFFEDQITYEAILSELRSINPSIVGFSKDELVSIDYKATSVSATIDLRWLEVLDGHILKMVIWYDNEWAYSSRINDIISML